uniref:Secreted protein n=1 Tax=Triticum urartu TaxID=4572 RepID=A0A8R7P4Y7_TRIUA
MSSDLGLRVLMLCLLRAHAMACSGCHPPAPTLIPSPPLTLLLLLVTQVHGRVPAPLSNCCRWTRHEPSWLLPPPTLLNLTMQFLLAPAPLDGWCLRKNRGLPAALHARERAHGRC